MFAAVESDIVGYTTITTNPGFNMQGVVFQGLEGEAEVSFNDLLIGEFRDGDQIQVYVQDGSMGTYDVYTFLDGRGWTIGRGSSADDSPVHVGTAFWLNTPNREVKVTIKGSVTRGDWVYLAKKGTQMLASALPVEIPLNPKDSSVVWTGFHDGDQIQWLNELGGYDTSSYKDGQWTSGRGAISTKVIPVGSSVWLIAGEAGATLKVKNP